MGQALVGDLLAEVRLTLDENQKESAYLESGTDNMELDEIIRAKLPDAVKAIHSACPAGMLEPLPMDIPEAAQYKGTDGSGYVVLPPDFLRLVHFKLVSWNRGCSVAHEEGSRTALMQRNPFTRGTPLKPVCVFSHDLNGNRVLRYYTSDGGNHKIDISLYVPVPQIKTVGGVETLHVSELARVPIVNYCAGLVEASRGNDGRRFFDLASSLIS